MTTQQLTHVATIDSLSGEEISGALSPEHVNLVVHERSRPHWAELVAEAVHSLEESYQFWLIRQDISELTGQVRESLRKGGFPAEAVEPVVADVTTLATCHVEATGDREPFVSLRTIDARYFSEGASSVSSHMHIDTATVTLTCTYVGNGPEYTPNHNVRRDLFIDRKMQRPHENLAEIIRDPEVLIPSSAFDVQVLKGEIRQNEDTSSLEFLENFLPASELEPFNVGRGLLHRGPGLRSGKRLVLTVSSMRVPRFAST